MKRDHYFILLTLLFLYIFNHKTIAQLGPNGTGFINGYEIAPNAVLGSSKPEKLSAGYYHNLAIRKDGTIVAKGWNAYSQSTVPRGINQALSISGGYFHSVEARYVSLGDRVGATRFDL